MRDERLGYAQDPIAHNLRAELFPVRTRQESNALNLEREKYSRCFIPAAAILIGNNYK